MYFVQHILISLLEFRGMWVATVYNIDWPLTPYQTTAESQAELQQVVDNIVDLNFNAIIFQVGTISKYEMIANK